MYNKLTVEYTSTSVLRVAEYNPRTHTNKEKENLKQSLTRFGLVDPIICNNAPERLNIVIGGHFRLKVAKELGFTEVPVVYVNIPDIAKEKELNLRLNKNTGQWDFDLLKTFKFDFLTDIGFDKVDLKFWDQDLNVKEEDFDVDKELKRITKPTTILGDVIELDKHRLICGDSTNPEVLKKLFGNERASMIYSDPVYNLKINYDKGIGGKQNYGGNVIDNRTDDEYKEFLKRSMVAALNVSHENLHIFYWVDQSYIFMPQLIYRELGIRNRRVCMWIKNGQNPTPSVAFSKCYEPCVYGTKGNPFLNEASKNFNEVLNREMTTGNELISTIDDQLSVWVEKRLSSKDYSHATSKPSQLHEKAIRRCTKPNDIILDSFGGSGSTLIAAHQLKRRAFLVELEPVFCDLIIKRFEKLTGMKAKIIRNHEES